MWCIKFQQSQGSVHRFCGTDTFPVPEFYSSDRTAIVTFKSDEYMINNGLRFFYQATGKLQEMPPKNLSTVLFVCFIHWNAIQRSEILTCFWFSVSRLQQRVQSDIWLPEEPWLAWSSPQWYGLFYHSSSSPKSHNISLFPCFQFGRQHSLFTWFPRGISKYTNFVSLCKNLLNSKDISMFGSSLHQIWVELTELGTNLLPKFYGETHKVVRVRG